MQIAIQLYSLKDTITELGFDEVLRRVAEAGFDGVEFAGYHQLGIDGTAAAIKRYGLKAMGAHISLEGFLNPSFERDAAALKLHSAAVPAISQERFIKDFESVANDMAIAVKKCGNIGIPAYYHNHAHEFINGKDYLQKLCGAVPGLLLEADIFWIKAAGFPPLEYFCKHADTIGVLHIKEMHPDGVNGFNPVVGQGISDSRAVIELAVQAGHKWCVLEAEKIHGDPFDYIAQCAAAIKGFIAGA